MKTLVASKGLEIPLLIVFVIAVSLWLNHEHIVGAISVRALGMLLVGLVILIAAIIGFRYSKANKTKRITQPPTQDTDNSIVLKRRRAELVRVRIWMALTLVVLFYVLKDFKDAPSISGLVGATFDTIVFWFLWRLSRRLKQNSASKG